MFITAIYPPLTDGISSLISTTTNLCEKIETSIKIIEESNDRSSEYIWVKNTGSSPIPVIENSDIFFGEINDFQRIQYDERQRHVPSWNYVIENDDGNERWDPGETIQIEIKYLRYREPPKGDYYVKMILYNGISAEDTFSI
jgi:archaellum component FlaG (FlaF/FlaG flagellin family)